MTKPKHTPGPWRARCRHVDYKGGPWDENEFLQWEVAGPRVPYGRGDFHQADAYLVAAAPDMYEALRKALGVISGEVMDKKGLIEALEAGRAALAKASGESPQSTSPQSGE